MWPLTGQSKKQGCVSHSTPEAELVAADHALRTVGVPALDLWSTLFERPDTVVSFHEDNETAIHAMRQGHSPTMRHLERTHGVCLRWLHARFQQPHYDLQYERSALQAADIYTKAFVSSAEWTRNMKLINHIDPKLFWQGRSAGTPCDMLTEHKGGVVFDYWTHNPWFEQPTATHSTPSAISAALVSPLTHTTRNTHEYDEHAHFDDVFQTLDYDDYATTYDDDDGHDDVHDP